MDYYIQIKYGTIEHDIERARRKNFMEFEIGEGWTSDDLSALLPYKDEVKGLWIKKKMKLKHLMEFPNLKWLKLDGFNERIDFSCFPQLENLRLCVNRKVVNLNTLKNLKILELIGNYGDDLTCIQELVSLEKLYVSWSNLKSLKGIENLKRLIKLDVVESKCLTELGDIEEISTLQWILISDCKNLIVKVDFGKLKNLEFLYLVNAGIIENVQFLIYLSNIKEFNFYRTTVIDGDLTPCFNVKELVIFDKKSHYSHNDKAIMKFINARISGKNKVELPLETYNLPYFNDISINPLEECEITENIQGANIGISLNFDREDITKEELENTKRVLEKIEEIYLIANNYVKGSLGKRNEANRYITEVIKCMDRDELEGILQDIDKNLSLRERVLSQVHLSVIHIRPLEDCKMNIYFTIEEGWDDILTIFMDSEGKVTDAAIES